MLTKSTVNPDFLQTRYDELSIEEIETLKEFIATYFKKDYMRHRAYSLKQKMTRVTGIYIYQADMYRLMVDAGFRGYIADNGDHILFAQYNRLANKL